MAERSLWGKIRLVILLILLFIVAMNTWLSQVRSTDWKSSLWIVIYPVNADGGSDTQAYIQALEESHFDDIEQFLVRESSRYGLPIAQPAEVFLSSPVSEQPPSPPINASMLQSVMWSLKLRYWAWTHDSWEGIEPDIKIYMRFFSLKNNRVLAHSLGLQKGMIGVVNGFASVDYQAQNNFVAMHEILHTLGATDKYSAEDNQPVWPDGYADPYQTPLLPQFRTEIMGGRAPQTKQLSLVPESLQQVVVGPLTAQELNWIQIP